ncbi:MAG: hypothetical protein ACR2HG_11420 [Pyrinomonadaceae bacterium]
MPNAAVKRAVSCDKIKAMEDEKEQLRAWAENWKRAGKVLEELRREEIRNSSLPDSIILLSDACESALYLNPPEPVSGLLEQQKLFSRLRKK